MKYVFGPVLALLAVACGNEEEPRTDRAGAPSSTTSPSSETAPPARVSQFTDLKDCRVLEANPDEGGYSLSRCSGAGGYRLLVSVSDARENLLLEAPGRTGKDGAVSLDLSKGTSGGFSRVGDKAEWRGTPGEPFRPDVLVIRHLVVEMPDTPEKETGHLLAFALRGGEPCLIARVAPGPGQSDSVRRKADGPLSCAAD